MSISVVVVDDQQMVRAGLRMIVETEPDLTVVGEARDGIEAVSMVRRVRPDDVLMDIAMPARTAWPPPAPYWPRSSRRR